jgi:hypothetical protein
MGADAVFCIAGGAELPADPPHLLLLLLVVHTIIGAISGAVAGAIAGD